MKKIILTILALTMIVSLFGCDTVSEEGTTAQKEQETNLTTDADDNTEKETNQTADTEIKIEINTEKDTSRIEVNTEKETTQIEQKYLLTYSGLYVYCSSGENASSGKEEYKYKDVKELGLVSITPEYSYSVDETKGKTIKYSFNKKDAELEYDKSRICLTETSGLVAKYNNYDKYKYKDGSRTTISFFTESSQLRDYFNPTKIEGDGITKIDKEQAVQIANEFIIDLLGEDVFNTYTLNGSVGFDSNKYWISYIKYFYGFRTTDTITMCINMDGSISAYVGLYVSMYDEIMKTITFDDIEFAEIELEESLHLRNKSIVDKVLEMNDKGEVCMSLYVLHGSEQQYYDAFYLPITPSNQE